MVVRLSTRVEFMRRLLLTECTQTRTEFQHPTRFESKQSISAGRWETPQDVWWQPISAHRRAGVTSCNSIGIRLRLLSPFFAFCSGNIYPIAQRNTQGPGGEGKDMSRRRIGALRRGIWLFFSVGDERTECLCLWGIE